MDIYIETTKNCNLSCKTCFLPPLKEGRSPRHPDEPEFFPLALYRKLMEEIAVPGIDRDLTVYLTGGEPFLHPHLEDFLRLSWKRVERLFVFTNGTIHSEHVLAKLAEFGPCFVLVSIDGTQRVHDHLRGRGNFRRAFRMIEMMRGIKKSDPLRGPKIVLNTVVNRMNLGCLEDVFRLGEKWKVNAVNFSFIQWMDAAARSMCRQELAERIGACDARIKMLDGFSDDLGRLTPVQIRRLISQIGRIRSRSNGSSAPRLNFFPSFSSEEETVRWFSPGAWKIDSCQGVLGNLRIYMNGDVYPQCGIPFYRLGNLSQSSLDDIIRGERAVLLRAEIQRNGCFYLCQRCCRRSPESRSVAPGQA